MKRDMILTLCMSILYGLKQDKEHWWKKKQPWMRWGFPLDVKALEGDIVVHVGISNQTR